MPSFLLRSLCDTDYRVTKNLMRERFCEADTNCFTYLWKIRNLYSSLCLEYGGCMVAFALVVDNKIEYLAVNSLFEGRGLGKILVQYAVETIQEIPDFKCAWLLTADNPALRHWYSRLGFEHSSTSRDSCGISGDIMIYRFKETRDAARIAKRKLMARSISC